MIITRPFWQNLIEEAWRQRNVIWLMGIRRVGKTSLCQSLPDIEYLDCESPRVRQNMVVDPEAFLESKKGQRIIIDEIHKLEEPSELLKLAADYYPDVYIIATGSSTLGASKKIH
jgi:predicted AAA+ superfamily ATPase